MLSPTLLPHFVLETHPRVLSVQPPKRQQVKVRRQPVRERRCGDAKSGAGRAAWNKAEVVGGGR